jgi:hypothetical protein
MTTPIDLPELPPIPHPELRQDIRSLELESWARSYAEKAVLAERERICEFIKNDYERQWIRPWREDLTAAIRG